MNRVPAASQSFSYIAARLKIAIQKKHGVINADRLVVMKLVHAENKELY